MELRRARLDDTGPVADLLRTSFPERVWPYMPITQHGAHAYLAASIALPEDARDREHYVVVDGSTVSAYAMFHFLLGTKDAFLSYICVRPGARRKNVASRMMDAFVAEHDPKSLTLDVFADNEGARAFYARQGFVPAGATNWRVRSLAPGAARRDGLKMRNYHNSTASLSAYGFCEVDAIWDGREVSLGRLGDQVVRVRDPDLFESPEFGAALVNVFPTVRELLFISSGSVSPGERLVVESIRMTKRIAEMTSKNME